MATNVLSVGIKRLSGYDMRRLEDPMRTHPQLVSALVDRPYWEPNNF